jgi:hypothetical protein
MLDVLLGEWSMEARFPNAPPSDLRGRATFEWMAGDKFLIQRWEVPIPEAPDGIAIIGAHEGGDALLQHYFDSRGVARVYDMTLGDGVWTLSRTRPDFSPLGFAQRFKGVFSDDGMRIDGAWELSHDDGGTWEHDFDLIYTRR